MLVEDKKYDLYTIRHPHYHNMWSNAKLQLESSFVLQNQIFEV